MDILAEVERMSELPTDLKPYLRQFFTEYQKAVREPPVEAFLNYLDLLEKTFASPHPFEIFHEAIRENYRLGLQIFAPLMDVENCLVLGKENLKMIQQWMDKKENVILLSNHQTEADPQVMSLLLEAHFPKLAEEMICVAGHRVTTDPLSIPFSMGRNLLCIYSKRHMDHPPEMRAQKQAHNMKAMKRLSALLSEGGKCVWIAPSGGRDRGGQVAALDPAAVELLYVKGHKSPVKTHLIPMAIRSADLLPPPDTLKKDLGEARSPKKCGCAISFGAPLPSYTGESSREAREQARLQRAALVQEQINKNYEAIEKELC